MPISFRISHCDLCDIHRLPIEVTLVLSGIFPRSRWASSGNPNHLLSKFSDRYRPIDSYLEEILEYARKCLEGRPSLIDEIHMEAFRHPRRHRRDEFGRGEGIDEKEKEKLKKEEMGEFSHRTKWSDCVPFHRPNVVETLCFHHVRHPFRSFHTFNFPFPRVRV